MIKRSVVRSVVDALIAVLTWTAATAGVLWFYDWLGRWYVVVGVLLAIVGVAMVSERTKAPAVDVPASLASLPAQREPAPIEIADVAWSPTAEQQIA